MKGAKNFAEALCYCGKQISKEFLRKHYETKWSELQMIETGLAGHLQQPQKVRKFECCNCAEKLNLDDLREMMCNHRYCVECLKKLMQNSIDESKEKLKCAKCKKELDDGVLKYLDTELYEKYVSALSENS